MKMMTTILHACFFKCMFVCFFGGKNQGPHHVLSFFFLKNLSVSDMRPTFVLSMCKITT